MSAVPADFLVNHTRRRVLEYFDMWIDVDATECSELKDLVCGDLEGLLNDFQAAVELATRARALAERSRVSETTP